MAEPAPHPEPTYQAAQKIKFDERTSEPVKTDKPEHPVKNAGHGNSNDGYRRYLEVHRSSRGPTKPGPNGTDIYSDGPFKGKTVHQADFVAHGTYQTMDNKARQPYLTENDAHKKKQADADDAAWEKQREREKIIRKDIADEKAAAEKKEKGEPFVPKPTGEKAPVENAFDPNALPTGSENWTEEERKKYEEDKAAHAKMTPEEQAEAREKDGITKYTKSLNKADQRIYDKRAHEIETKDGLYLPAGETQESAIVKNEALKPSKAGTGVSPYGWLAGHGGRSYPDTPEGEAAWEKVKEKYDGKTADATTATEETKSPVANTGATVVEKPPTTATATPPKSPVDPFGNGKDKLTPVTPGLDAQKKKGLGGRGPTQQGRQTGQRRRPMLKGG